MNTRIALPLLLTLILVWAGCGKKEVVHQGLPLSTWIERLSSPEPEVRGDAAKAIGEIGPAAIKAEDRLLLIARNDRYPDVKIAAILALKSLGVSTLEFEEFLEQATAPLFPNEDEMGNFPPMDEYDEFETDSSEPFSPVEDDIDFLLELANPVDTGGVITPYQPFPEDVTGQSDWAEQKRKEQITGMLNQLQNPYLLAEIIKDGSLDERRLAVRMLASRVGVNNAVVDVLESARFDPDSLLRATAIEALKNWTRPEE